MQTLADQRKEINIDSLLKIERGQGNTVKDRDGLLNRKYNCKKQGWPIDEMSKGGKEPHMEEPFCATYPNSIQHKGYI